MARSNVADIIGIGAQKSATSWAAHVLNMHPTVWIPPEAWRGKEVSFFDGRWEKGREWYRKVMTPPRDNLKVMDVSPGYTTIGPGKLAACKELSPDARVFVLLRDPVQRDWSSLAMQATRRKFDLTTASLIDSLVFYDRENVARYSTYVSTVKAWQDAYGKQLLVGLYDDICSDSHAFYERLCAHVGLRPDDVERWRQRIEKRIFPGSGIAIPDGLREFLSKKYAPMVERLEDVIGRDLSAWKATNS